MTEYQAAKTDCAHIDQKIRRVFTAYREAGGTMDASRGSISEPTVVDGKVHFGYSGGRFSPSDLLNEADLTLLLIERDKARKRQQEAQKVMNSLGITGVS